MPIVATPGSATANSYGTVAEAAAYFESQLNTSAWDQAIVDGTEESALIAATNRLEQLDYIGERATATQALEWPRIISDSYKWIDDTFPYDADEIPTKLKYAQFELALALLESGSGVAAGSVESLRIGSSVEVKYSAGSSAVDVSADYSGLPIQAAKWLKGIRLYPVLA